jgi:hypothetical protein
MKKEWRDLDLYCKVRKIVLESPVSPKKIVSIKKLIGFSYCRKSVKKHSANLLTVKGTYFNGLYAFPQLYVI